MKKLDRYNLKSVILYCIIGLILGVLVSRYVACLGIVEGSSMEPSYLDGDKLIIGKLATPDRGDIVVFNSTGKVLIKRVIAVPGDTVEIISSSVFVNKRKIDESYIKENEFEGGIVEGNPLELKNDEYFVMGDNRNYSSDSRIFGVVRKEDMIGVKLLDLGRGVFNGNLLR